MWILYVLFYWTALNLMFAALLIWRCVIATPGQISHQANYKIIDHMA
jgi:hypothetical protein